LFQDGYDFAIVTIKIPATVTYNHYFIEERNGELDYEKIYRLSADECLAVFE